MARRRAVGAGFGTASKMIQSFLADSMERSRQAQLQQMITERQQGSDRINFAQSLLPMLQKGDLKPDALAPGALEAAGQFYDPTKVVPSPQERVGKIIQGLGEKNQFGQIPSDPEMAGSLQAQGLPTDFPPELVAALSGARQRTGALEPLKEMPFVDKEGIKQNQFVPQSQAPAYGALPQERTAGQEGQRELETALTGKLSPAYGVAEARIQNTIESLTRPEQVRTAGAKASAEAAGRLGQEFAPGVVNARVDQAGRIVGAQKSAEMTAAEKTGGVGGTLQVDERRALTYLPQLTAAHADALAMENAGGTGITPQALAASKSGVVGSVVRQFVNSPDQEYVQRAINFTNIEGLIKSGVTVREDEYDRYISNNFKLKGEPPNVTAKKQQTREAIIASAVAASGRGARAGGQTMGDAVVKGLIPPDVISAFQISNPQFEQGLYDTLAPHFDIMQDANGKVQLTPKGR